MNLQQFKQAFKLAQSNEDLTSHDFDNLYGCGLPGFVPVATTIGAVARLIRWQGLFMDGSWDMEEVDNVRRIGKSKFIVLD